MNSNYKLDEETFNKIPEGDNCANDCGICPFWKPITRDGENITRAKCCLIDYEEEQDYQGTFLWGMLKICDYKN